MGKMPQILNNLSKSTFAVSAVTNWEPATIKVISPPLNVQLRRGPQFLGKIRDSWSTSDTTEVMNLSIDSLTSWDITPLAFQSLTRPISSMVPTAMIPSNWNNSSKIAIITPYKLRIPLSLINFFMEFSKEFMDLIKNGAFGQYSEYKTFRRPCTIKVRAK